MECVLVIYVALERKRENEQWLKAEAALRDAGFAFVTAKATLPITIEQVEKALL